MLRQFVAVNATSSVCLQDLLLLVGPYGDWVKLDLEQPVALVQEVDGALLASSSTCWHP